MRAIWKTIVAVCVAVVLVLGGQSLLVADSPYDRNVHVERAPFGPDRPATLNHTSAADYAVEHERTRLENDLLASRGYTLDAGDGLVARCNQTSVSETNAGPFRVRLHCNGGIEDTKRLFQPGEFTYDVTYRVTDDETTQIDSEDYPFAERDPLGTPPS